MAAGQRVKLCKYRSRAYIKHQNGKDVSSVSGFLQAQSLVDERGQRGIARLVCTHRIAIVTQIAWLSNHCEQKNHLRMDNMSIFQVNGLQQLNKPTLGSTPVRQKSMNQSETIVDTGNSADKVGTDADMCRHGLQLGCIMV